MQKVKEIGLSWIVVKDLEAAVHYYTEVVGLNLLEFDEQYGWAELQGEDGGAVLGIARENPEEAMPAGQNAVITFTVDDIEEARAQMLEKGARCEGDILEIRGHIKMQTVIDDDGNRFQLCEVLHHSCSHC